MSFLAPFFLIAGGMLAVPVLMHLIRRQPKASQEFSSLLFLRPSPPRLTRRSRVDNWLLLLIRLLAIAMIVAAFSRPFLRSDAQTLVDAPRSFRVLLVDTSASMQRGDLWDQALSQVDAAVESMSDEDAFAIVTFDSKARVLRGFDAEDGSKPSDAKSLIQGQTPSYFGTELGTGLITAAELLTSLGEEGNNAERSIALISDLQEGGHAQTLQSFGWPEDIVVELFPVKTATPSNASAVVLQSNAETASDEDNADKPIRVAVTNAADSEIGNFQIRWKPTNPDVKTDLTTVNLQPGQTKIVRLATPPPQVESLELLGDDHSFDNEFYVQAPERNEQSVLFVGEIREDPRADLFYYLERTPIQSSYADFNFARWEPDAPSQLTEAESRTLMESPAIFVHSKIGERTQELLSTKLHDGGRVIVVVDSTTVLDANVLDTIHGLTDDPDLQLRAAEIRDYTTLTQIDFRDPLFQPLADPRYSDFSKIQFWSCCDVTLGENSKWQTIASFEGGSPAMLRHPVGKGELYLLAAGWQPTESRLALSTKFVPLISGLVQTDSGNADANYLWLGEDFQMEPTPTAELITPDDQILPAKESADLSVIDRPGRYQLRDQGESWPFVANIPVDESRTTPLEPAILEQLGVVLTSQEKISQLSEAQRQLRDMELENRQQWWQILLALALGLLLLETLLSSRQRAARAQDQASNAPPAPSVA